MKSSSGEEKGVIDHMTRFQTSSGYMERLLQRVILNETNITQYIFALFPQVWKNSLMMSEPNKYKKGTLMNIF